MIFEPINKTGGFACIGYDSLLDRLDGSGCCSDPIGLVRRALFEGQVAAYVQPEGETVFYRVPRTHWNQSKSLLEGEPHETLATWGMSSVPVKFRDLPLLFFLDEIEEWERCLSKVSLPLSPPSLAQCIDAGCELREGLWGYFTVLGWIISRDERTAGAIQQWAESQYAERGSAFSDGAYFALCDHCEKSGWLPPGDADQQLRQALEAGRMQGGSAKNRVSGEPELIERHQWSAWQRSFEYDGVALLANRLGATHVDFRWPSEGVRAAFPPGDPSSTVQAVPFVVSGAPGRRTSKQIWTAMFESRAAATSCLASLKQEAEAIAEMFNDDPRYKEWPRVSPRTVENGIRDKYRLIVRH